tara:strand:+ start:68 stop:820 length:753 start_codon:yes stop_codon:yes gene_type:complete
MTINEFQKIMQEINFIRKNSNYTATSNTVGLRQITVYENRLNNIRLDWCKQITDIILRYFKNDANICINDLGCNYFQLYKELKFRKLRFNYFGYDIDKKFIAIGLSKFQELHNKFKIINLENKKPRKTDISVLSATLEHSNNPLKLLNNSLETTKKLFLLRTWVGDDSKVELMKNSKFVNHPYFINQFSHKLIMEQFFKHRFIPMFIPDLATSHSKKYEVFKNTGIKRQFFIIVGEKVNKNFKHVSPKPN